MLTVRYAIPPASSRAELSRARHSLTLRATGDSADRVRWIVGTPADATDRCTHSLPCALPNLRASDVLLSRDQMVTALAAIGARIASAEQWPHGALRFSAKFDKRGYESVIPLSGDARAALDVYLRRHPTAGDVPLLPSNAGPHLACERILAGLWLTRAEKLAELPKLARGAWHPFRRSFASERRHLPDVDIMAVAGWRSSRVMRESYQHSDASGMLSVVEPAESRPKPSGSGTNEAQSEAK